MSQHLSASQREILKLHNHIAQLELMRVEYITLLNYLCVEHGQEGKFVVWNSKAQAIQVVPCKTEIKKTVGGETYLEVSRITGPNNEKQT